ncbi:hypothetical protein GXW82_26735 [Streptacidiphilus sp. 4-A2]|nr:hypothetical protein [Streptacidiphilus sp. 4-A2]
MAHLLISAVLGAQALSFLHLDEELPCRIRDLWQLLAGAAAERGPVRAEPRSRAGVAAAWGLPGERGTAAPHTAVGVTEW